VLEDLHLSGDAAISQSAKVLPNQVYPISNHCKTLSRQLT